MTLIQLYQAVLKYCGVKCMEDGSTITVFRNQDEPSTINDKKLMLPLPEVLKRASTDEIVFHPLQEYVNRGESPVVRRLRLLLNIRINMAVMMLMDKLLVVLESPAIQANLDPEQRYLIKSVGGGRKMAKVVADGSVIREKLATLANRFYTAAADSFFVQVYLKKNGTLEGTKHSRVGVVSFPFFEFIEDAPGLTKEDKQLFKELLAFIFPGSDKGDESWNGFSDSPQCPWLDCLLKTTSPLTDRIMELVNLYQDHMVDEETGTISRSLIFTDDWTEGMANLDRFQKECMLIPSQTGNEGTVETTAPAATGITAAVKAVDVNRPVAQPVAVPVTQQQVAQQAAPQPIYSQPQQPVYQQPMMGMQQPMMAPAVPHTGDGKLDLGTTIPSPMQYGQPMMPQQRQWAPTLGVPGMQPPMNNMMGGYVQAQPMMGMQQPMMGGYAQPQQQPMMGMAPMGYPRITPV